MIKKSDAKIISQFVEYQLDYGNSSGTVKLYSQIINQFSQWLEMNGSSLSSITRLDIQMYIKHLSQKGLRASTIETKYAAISSITKFMGKINLLQNIQKPECRGNRNIAPVSLERSHRNSILRKFERSGNLRNTAITYLLLYTGLRVSELVALNRKDVSIGERTGTILIKRGKGDIERKVPIPSEARFHLKNYLNARIDAIEALFLSNYKKRISIRSVQRIFESVSIHPHQLRHTYCRELVNAGIDIAIVAELAGHADINVTRRYSKPSFLELEIAIDKAFD